MPILALDANLALPPGLTNADAEQAALRFATVEVIDRRRPEPMRLPGEIPDSVNLTYRGGLRYRSRATHVWRFAFTSVRGFPESGYHLVGVRSQRQAYYSAYLRVGESEEAEDHNLAGWMAGDWRAYSARERVLAVYRKRLEEKPRAAARHYELALIGVALGTSLLTDSTVDALYYPGPLDEFLPAVQAAVAGSPGTAKVLALAAFLHERLAHFDQAARLYGEAAAADAESPLYAFLHADALLFRGDEIGARRAAAEAERRARARGSPYEFGHHRPSLVDLFRESLAEDAGSLREGVEGSKETRINEAAQAEEHRRAITIDPKKVPAAFHPLIPLARKWGVGDDPSRGYLTEHASEIDMAALAKALPPKRRGEIQAWLDSLGATGITSDEAGAFMYLLEALDEMGL